jgi:hypothetical protein
VREALCQALFFDSCIYVFGAFSGGKSRQYRGSASEGAYTPQTRVLVRFGLKPWQSAIKEIEKWQAMSRFQMAAMDRISAALTGMSVQELSQLREKDPEEAARRCAESQRLPKDFQDFLIDGALDDLFPRSERRDV